MSEKRLPTGICHRAAVVAAVLAAVVAAVVAAVGACRHATFSHPELMVGMVQSAWWERVWWTPRASNQRVQIVLVNYRCKSFGKPLLSV